MRNFRLVGLDPASFVQLFNQDESELRAVGACRRVATEPRGFPCRVSLQDAEVGDELLLLPFEHLSEDSPYRSSGPIYVRRNAQPRSLAPGEVPEYVSTRQISLRGYSAQHLMVDALVCEGADVAAQIASMFTDPRIAYAHLHNARPGCYSCRAERV